MISLADRSNFSSKPASDGHISTSLFSGCLGLADAAISASLLGSATAGAGGGQRNARGAATLCSTEGSAAHADRAAAFAEGAAAADSGEGFGFGAACETAFGAGALASWAGPAFAEQSGGIGGDEGPFSPVSGVNKDLATWGVWKSELSESERGSDAGPSPCTCASKAAYFCWSAASWAAIISLLCGGGAMGGNGGILLAICFTAVIFEACPAAVVLSTDLLAWVGCVGAFSSSLSTTTGSGLTTAGLPGSTPARSTSKIS